MSPDLNLKCLQYSLQMSLQGKDLMEDKNTNIHCTWVNVFRIFPEFRILRLSFHRISLKILNSGKKSEKQIITASLIYFQLSKDNYLNLKLLIYLTTKET